MNRELRERNIDAEIGANIKKFREIKNMSRQKLADIFHITDDALYRIETGQTGFSGIYAYILAQELDCDMNFIFGKDPVFQTDNVIQTDEECREEMACTLRYYASLLAQDEEEESEQS